jgi:mRNA interferase MazF
MPIFEPWDVVKVPFPYTNRPVQQFRPALIVACVGGAGSPALLWVLMITSASHRRWPGDVEISDLSAAGLTAPSLIRCSKIATIEAAHADRIGYLPAPGQIEVQIEVTKFFAHMLKQSPG